MKYWTQSVGALKMSGMLILPLSENLLPGGGAGNLSGENIPLFGGQISIGGLQLYRVSRTASKLQVH